MKTCDLHETARFISGEMSAVEIASFEDHLDHCEACRRRLEADSGGPEGWQSARDLLAYSPSRTSPSRSAAEAECLPDCTSAQVLALVSPSDDPAMIGRVGPYEISGLLGRGSAGIVLKGYDRALNRSVAIKILDPATSGVGAARQRFAREARAMAAISHEHLVPVFEVSEHAGLPYFVMEYVPGGSLERRLRQEGPFDALAVVRIGLQTALALAAAHRQGLVHRDIKPGNILLDRGTERVRVADFGLVRVANDVSFTRSGIVAGTPQFMAPEQVRAEPCDGQSDLFSLGAVMYALCTGHSPFRADTVYGVMQRITRDVPRSVREQNPAIPVWLDEFIQRLLAKDRAVRFASAEEVAQLLQDELSHLQDPHRDAPPRRLWRKAGFPLKRARQVVLAGVGCFTLFGALSAWYLHHASLNSRDQGSPAPEGASPAGATERSAATERPPALWWADGTVELQRAVKRLQGDGIAGDEEPEYAVNRSVTPDSIRQRLSVLRQELDPELRGPTQTYPSAVPSAK